MNELYTCNDCLFAEINDCDDLICFASRIPARLHTRRRICRHFKCRELYRKPLPIGFGAFTTKVPTVASN